MFFYYARVVWSVWPGEQKKRKEKKRKEIRGPFVVTPVSVGTTLHAEEFKQLYYQTKNTSWNQPRLNKEGIYKKLNIN